MSSGLNRISDPDHQYIYPFVAKHPVLFQVLKKISSYIQEQNEKIYAPRGLLLTDPIERGMRVVSFVRLTPDLFICFQFRWCVVNRWEQPLIHRARCGSAPSRNVWERSLSLIPAKTDEENDPWSVVTLTSRQRVVALSASFPAGYVTDLIKSTHEWQSFSFLLSLSS